MRVRFSTLMKLARSLAVAGLFVVLVALLMLWLSGQFSPKIDTTTAAAMQDGRTIPAGMVIATARLLRLPVTEPAVGTIRAVHATTITSRILARVVQIDLKAGQLVKQGETLVQLDDTDLKAHLQQAQSAVDSANAERNQAEREARRTEPLLPTHAISQTDYERAHTALQTADANLAKAKQAAAEAQAVLEFSSIRAPMDGIVVDKKVDVGDTASPGLPLLSLYDPHRMQLVANVRESLSRRLLIGQDIGVRLDAMDHTCIGQISEIVPDAQSDSRTFQVKVTGPCLTGIYTGMFGRILIPLDEEEVLVIPSIAVRRVGQLELVDVAEDGTMRRRAVRTGRVIGSDCQVLSGLAAGEKVVIPTTTTQPTRGVQP